MNFKTNKKGGWIVPPFTVISAWTVVPDSSEFGYGCTLGYGCTFGNVCTFGSGCTFGNVCTFGYDCKFGYGCKFGNVCTFVNDYAFGYGCKFGYGCTFGNVCTFGNDCQINTIKIVKLMTLSNVDDSGRQVKLIFDGRNVHVEAGCFFGNVNDFCEKAESEGKHFYSKMIRANALEILDYYKIS
jgi:hypothetical protein